MMNEPVEPPLEVLAQADQLVQQINDEVVPIEQLPVEQQENLGQPVDVLMEFVLEEEHVLPENAEVIAQENTVLLQEDNIFVAPVDSVVVPQPAVLLEEDASIAPGDAVSTRVVPGENLERAIILYTPPFSQQFEEIDLALAHIQATAADPVSKTVHDLVLPVMDSVEETMATFDDAGDGSSDGQAKRSWSHAFDEAVGFAPNDVAASSDVRKEMLVLHDVPHKFTPLAVSVDSAPVMFQTADNPGQAKKARQRRKKEVPLVDSSVKRCTRSAALKEGYRVPPISDLAPKPRKRARKTVPASRGPGPALVADSGTAEPSGDFSVTPPIPVATLQRIGEMLGIDAQLLTVDKLAAKSGMEDSKSG
jgi:hypothetical protein